MGEVGEWENSVWKWRLRWRRTIFEWESFYIFGQRAEGGRVGKLNLEMTA